MNDTHTSTAEHPDHYEMRLRGHLPDAWENWFEGLAITRSKDGETLLSGPVVDQAALYALLRKVRDLGMPLLEVKRLVPTPSDATANPKEIEPNGQRRVPE